MPQRDAIDSADSAGCAAAADDLTCRQRWLAMLAAFLAWMFAGLEISLFVLIVRPATLDLLAVDTPRVESQVGAWFAWYQCAFLFGAAAGGWLFGYLGDRTGRTRAMGASILCYSVTTGVSYFVADPWTLFGLRFIACLGVGGVWPNCVSLTVEIMPEVSRPLIAGLLGAASNVGFVLLGAICCIFVVTPESWRWTLLVGTAPAVLGVMVFVALPESPRWLAAKQRSGPAATAAPLRRDPAAAFVATHADWDLPGRDSGDRDRGECQLVGPLGRSGRRRACGPLSEIRRGRTCRSSAGAANRAGRRSASQGLDTSHALRRRRVWQPARRLVGKPVRPAADLLSD